MLGFTSRTRLHTAIAADATAHLHAQQRIDQQQSCSAVRADAALHLHLFLAHTRQRDVSGCLPLNKAIRPVAQLRPQVEPTVEVGVRRKRTAAEGSRQRVTVVHHRTSGAPVDQSIVVVGDGTGPTAEVDHGPGSLAANREGFLGAKHSVGLASDRHQVVWDLVTTVEVGLVGTDGGAAVGDGGRGADVVVEAGGAGGASNDAVLVAVVHQPVGGSSSTAGQTRREVMYYTV